MYYLQIESEALLASALANVTQDTVDFKKEDVSMSVTLLDTVANSSETVQEEVVSGDIVLVVCCRVS